MTFRTTFLGRRQAGVSLLSIIIGLTVAGIAFFAATRLVLQNMEERRSNQARDAGSTIEEFLRAVIEDKVADTLLDQAKSNNCSTMGNYLFSGGGVFPASFNSNASNLTMSRATTITISDDSSTTQDNQHLAAAARCNGGVTLSGGTISLVSKNYFYDCFTFTNAPTISGDVTFKSGYPIFAEVTVQFIDLDDGNSFNCNSFSTATMPSIAAYYTLYWANTAGNKTSYLFRSGMTYAMKQPP
jgi:type II secretory pathway pseudopilin PulG